MASVLSAIDGHGQKKMLVNLAGKYFGNVAGENMLENWPENVSKFGRTCSAT